MSKRKDGQAQGKYTLEFKMEAVRLVNFRSASTDAPMKQQALAMAADQTFENYRKPTRRDEFLKTIEAIVPWSALCQVIEPHYPKAGNGRPPIGLERMLRIHFVRHRFNLAVLACEEALYDSASLRSFVGIDLGRESVPDSTTITKFRKLLNDNKLGEELFDQFGKELQARNFKVNTSRSILAPLWTPPSLVRRVRPRMWTRSATTKCTRPARASNGISE